MLTAGHCAACQRPIWKSVVHPITQDRHLLWPRKDSVYVMLETETGFAPGIGYCAACVPPLGTPGPGSLTRLVRHDSGGVLHEPMQAGPVIGYESAKGRYRAWFQAPHGAFLAAWVNEELRVDPAAIMAEWEAERA
jgi:hypothetical protein